ncbi:MAG: hypothetical protein Q8M16_12405 [Pirellulaceae bacterium]|nr:hypothetical protein [Pirellulaceae bacterium]
MNNQEYLAKVSRPVRSIAILAMLFTCGVNSACLLLIIGVLFVVHDNVPWGPIFGSFAIFGFLSFTSGWISIRLIREQRAANGQTLMPIWFIQIFGVIFLIGTVTTAVITGKFWLLGQSVGIAIVMIGVRSLLRQESTWIE